ncbi:molybdopterin dinucleotide binding domain-containing protein [Paracoccus jeotgali]|uniref:molybdopterin dinucleotide binding domain-containing protein n=1 Tax=Paracoccus jeotgali TaxID=2065379 RepID=UPI0028AAB51A|nr:molybdopterin dinucleotide binding domain-containing protein [Paracoccus jeotgali]
MSTRRNILKGAAATGALATFGAGYADTARNLVKGKWAGAVPASALTGNSQAPEFSIDPVTGDLELNPDIAVSYAMCIGCTTMCGVRVKIDRKENRVLRVTGNPYSPLSTNDYLPYETPVRDSFKAMAQVGARQGHGARSTACGRGNAVLQQVENPRRVLQPLKRVGPRGSGEWQTISFEQLVEEICDGGDLFGEGRVAGLREIRDLDTPIRADAPEMGPRANGLAMLSSVDDGRDVMNLRWLKQGFGSTNYVRHGSYCGGSYRSGSGALFGDVKKMPHAKPDFSEAEFILFVGTAPGNAGNPFKRIGALLAEARSTGKLDYVVVDPVLNNADSGPSGQRARWLPIIPGTDGALAMGIIRWMFENDRVNQPYLAQPSADAAEAAGEANWTNATHLVITDPDHPRVGRHLRGSDLGLTVEGEAYGEADPYTVATAGGAEPAGDRPAPLFFQGRIETPQGPVEVATGLSLLRAEAMSRSLDDYAADCGIPAATIADLANRLTSHGRKAAVNSHGGMMSGSGFYNAWSLMTINALIGNLNHKGGTVISGGWFPDSKGPVYDLETVQNEVVPTGLPLGRNVPYEKTSAFKAAKAAGKPYPANSPWYPNAPGLATEWFASMLGGDPYGVEALFLRNANPVYGIGGIQHMLDKLRDPAVVPLIVAIDPFINESSALADYIVPDTVMFESWGFAKPWNGVPTKVTTARWPVIEPRVGRTAEGVPIDSDMFLIALAKRLDLPGFGENAIPDADGNLHPLNRPEDFYLRGAVNVASLGTPVADASDDDIEVSGVTRILDSLQSVLRPDEWRRAATIYAKGGRYENRSQSHEGELARHRWQQPLQIYNEGVGAAKNAMTGQRSPGTAGWREPVFADGTPVAQHYPAGEWPLKVVSFKSPLQNSYSVGAKVLLRIVGSNPVHVGSAVAEAHGLSTGDRVRLSTPGGSLETEVVVREGVAPGTIAIEHGFGHRAFGASDITIDGNVTPADPRLASGVSQNDLGMLDPTRNQPGVWVDPISGATVRQGLPARIERI